MSYPFGPLGPATLVSATASSVAAGPVALPDTTNALRIVNTSATLYATVQYGVGAQTAVLGTGGVTVPPNGTATVECNPQTTHFAAIGSGAGPSAVIIQPVRVSLPR